MKKLFVVLVVTATLLTLSAQAAMAWGLIETSGIGVSENPIHRVVSQGMVMKNIGTIDVLNAGVTYYFGGPNYPQTEDHFKLIKVEVFLDDVIVCEFAGRNLSKDTPVTCMVDTLAPGQVLKTMVYMKSNKPGEYTNAFIHHHDGINTPAGFAAFFVP